MEQSARSGRRLGSLAKIRAARRAEGDPGGLIVASPWSLWLQRSGCDFLNGLNGAKRLNCLNDLDRERI